LSEPDALNLPPKQLLYCSFCGKSQTEVKKLIAGPTVFICDECVELCAEIVRTEMAFTHDGPAESRFRIIPFEVPFDRRLSDLEIQLLPGFLAALESGIPDCSIRLVSISERTGRHSVHVQVQAPRERYPENLGGFDLLNSLPMTEEAINSFMAARRVEWDRRYDALAAAGYERPTFVSPDVLTQDLHDLSKKLDQALRDELGKGSRGEKFAKILADLKAELVELLVPHVKAHAVPPPPPRVRPET
jgi:hypothetical protein